MSALEDSVARADIFEAPSPRTGRALPPWGPGSARGGRSRGRGPPNQLPSRPPAGRGSFRGPPPGPYAFRSSAPEMGGMPQPSPGPAFARPVPFAAPARLPPAHPLAATAPDHAMHAPPGVATHGDPHGMPPPPQLHRPPPAPSTGKPPRLTAVEALVRSHQLQAVLAEAAARAVALFEGAERARIEARRAAAAQDRRRIAAALQIEEGRLREAEDVAAVEALADEGTAEARGAAAHAAEVRERVQALRREAAEGARREGEAEAETREGARRAAAVAAAAARVVATARGEANAVATAATAAGREGEAWRLLASAADGYRAAESALGMGAWDRAVGAEDGVEFDLLSSSGPMDARWRVEELEEELGRVRAEAAGAVVAAEERWRVEEARRVEECAKRVEEAAEGEGKALVERVGQLRVPATSGALSPPGVVVAAVELALLHGRRAARKLQAVARGASAVGVGAAEDYEAWALVAGVSGEGEARAGRVVRGVEEIIEAVRRGHVGVTDRDALLAGLEAVAAAGRAGHGGGDGDVAAAVAAGGVEAWGGSDWRGDGEGMGLGRAVGDEGEEGDKGWAVGQGAGDEGSVGVPALSGLKNAQLSPGEMSLRVTELELEVRHLKARLRATEIDLGRAEEERRRLLGDEGGLRAAMEEVEELRAQVEVMGNYDRTRGQLAKAMAGMQAENARLRERLKEATVEGPGASRLVREYQMNDQLQLQRRVARAEAEAEVLRRQMEQLHEWAAATGARSQAEIRRLRAVVGRYEPQSVSPPPGMELALRRKPRSAGALGLAPIARLGSAGGLGTAGRGFDVASGSGRGGGGVVEGESGATAVGGKPWERARRGGDGAGTDWAGVAHAAAVVEHTGGMGLITGLMNDPSAAEVPRDRIHRGAGVGGGVATGAGAGGGVAPGVGAGAGAAAGVAVGLGMGAGTQAAPSAVPGMGPVDGVPGRGGGRGVRGGSSLRARDAVVRRREVAALKEGSGGVGDAKSGGEVELGPVDVDALLRAPVLAGPRSEERSAGRLFGLNALGEPEPELAFLPGLAMWADGPDGKGGTKALPETVWNQFARGTSMTNAAVAGAGGEAEGDGGGEDEIGDGINLP